MRIEPVPALVGHVAVPGDKSISHRAVLIGAVCEGETRISGFGRSADTEATIAAVRALGVEVVEEDVDVLRVRGVGLRRAAPARRADRLRERRHAHAAPRRAPRRARRAASSSSGTSRSRRARWSASPSRSGGWARAVETTDGHAPARRRGRARCSAIDYELPVASAQVKSAVLLAGRAGRRAHDRRRADADARSHRAAARAGGRTRHATPDERDGRARGTSSGCPRSRSRATSRRRRPSSSRRRSCRARRSRCTASGSIRGAPGSSTCSSAWGRGSRSTTGGRSAASLPVTSSYARPISSARRSRRRRCRRSSTSCRSSPSPPVMRAATPSSTARRSFASRSRIGSTRSWRSSAASAATARRRATASAIRGVPARLRGGVVDSRGDHRLAMLGAVAGVASREGVELRGAEAVETSFPGFYDVLEQVAPGAVHYPPAT